MSLEKENYKIIAAVAIGAIGGLLLGKYVWGKDGSDRPLSKHLATLSKVLEQIEGIETKEAEDLKERIHNILTTIESNYGITKG
ncbi:MAG: hypothetical protein HQ565_09620 [Bacteroidetes bacterium]|nr:hypothetical protein [Bacteroidota bacterium]